MYCKEVTRNVLIICEYKKMPLHPISASGED